MLVLPGPMLRSRLWHAGQVASDVLIATALIWALPLLLGAMGALVALLLN